ncbi:anti-sigma factor [Flavobacterium sp. CYK-4]|uniref:anti-sigma factor n=1 Tax=Flavobacterium lotistagni TaxID=2709660 RepID=UPI0014081B8E|nr:anti-sigma factor [Flavobacterium lotistagni]NHM07195.1 anti-sigma factor [Flavobacterium lotistagni]
MEKQPDAMENLFKNLQGQWDIYEPHHNHHERFADKQAHRKNKNNWRYVWAVAATIVVFIGCFTLMSRPQPDKNLKLASRETQQTDSIFTCMIKAELEKIKEKRSPANEKIIADALSQMKILEADYEKIKQELATNGENKQIIYAMIRNLKTRISFLENVLDQINNTEKLITTTNEKTL